ncbi:MAG: hypothetical protein II800_01565 [Lachnospiraceae bacterium]|nr:hypothetical protein [Lachnospiraceae bacterium]
MRKRAGSAGVLIGLSLLLGGCHWWADAEAKLQAIEAGEAGTAVDGGADEADPDAAGISELPESAPLTGDDLPSRTDICLGDWYADGEEIYLRISRAPEDPYLTESIQPGEEFVVYDVVATRTEGEAQIYWELTAAPSVQGIALVYYDCRTIRTEGEEEQVLSAESTGKIVYQSADDTLLWTDGEAENPQELVFERGM